MTTNYTTVPRMVGRSQRNRRQLQTWRLPAHFLQQCSGFEGGVRVAGSRGFVQLASGQVAVGDCSPRAPADPCVQTLLWDHSLNSRIWCVPARNVGPRHQMVGVGDPDRFENSGLMWGNSRRFLALLIAGRLGHTAAGSNGWRRQLRARQEGICILGDGGQQKHSISQPESLPPVAVSALDAQGLYFGHRILVIGLRTGKFPAPRDRSRSLGRTFTDMPSDDESNNASEQVSDETVVQLLMRADQGDAVAAERLLAHSTATFAVSQPADWPASATPTRFNRPTWSTRLTCDWCEMAACHPGKAGGTFLLRRPRPCGES